MDRTYQLALSASLFSSNRIDLIVKTGRSLPDAPHLRIQLATDATLDVLL
jgi:hypothetical protein